MTVKQDNLRPRMKLLPGYILQAYGLEDMIRRPKSFIIGEDDGTNVQDPKWVITRRKKLRVYFYPLQITITKKRNEMGITNEDLANALKLKFVAALKIMRRWTEEDRRNAKFDCSLEEAIKIGPLYGMCRIAAIEEKYGPALMSDPDQDTDYLDIRCVAK
jgi:hypothetical protein